MAIKVNIPYGQNSASVSGLYQWDYGQELEIESTDLGNMIGEVHFACSTMSEAIAVPCTFSLGIGTVTIPDECLEQSSTINAWIYEIVGTQGRTRKALTINIIARTRPNIARDIPPSVTDKYTQLITEINEAINKIEDGTVTAKKAEVAEKANSADSLTTNASMANYALEAGKATYDKNGNDITTTYVREDVSKILRWLPPQGKFFERVNKNVNIYIGTLSDGKSIDDIVNVGLHLEMVNDENDNNPPYNCILRFSAVKVDEVKNGGDPINLTKCVHFTSTIPYVADGDVNGFGMVKVDAYVGYIGEDNKTIYIQFHDAACNFFEGGQRFSKTMSDIKLYLRNAYCILA